MRQALAIFKALSDINRLRLLRALMERGELCVCQAQELIALAPSTTSKHLSVLTQAGLLTMRKEGRWAHYRVAEPDEAPPNAAELLDWVWRQSLDEKITAEDKRRLDQILSFTPEELCQRQANGLECCSSAPATPAAAKSRKATPAR